MSNRYSRMLLVVAMLVVSASLRAQVEADSIAALQDSVEVIQARIKALQERAIERRRADSIRAVRDSIIAVLADSVQAQRDRFKALQDSLDAMVGDTAKVEKVEVQDTAAIDSLALPIPDNRPKSYAERRGMITRDAMKTVFVPKGQWMVGGQIAWNQWNNDNLNYLMLKDINFEAYTFSAGPSLGYFFRDNVAAGLRFSYKRYYLNMGELDLNLGDDLNISLKDLYYLQHNYETTGFLRAYIPLGDSKVFGFFGEAQFNYTFSEGRNTTGRDDTFSATYEKCHELELGIAGGMAVFLTDYLATELMVNVGGYHVKWGNQNTNNIEKGTSSSSGANFRINLFSIKFGVMYYL